MAIMATRLIGLVNSDPIIVSDEKGHDISLRFTVKVKDGSQRIVFSAYISDTESISKWKSEIIRGSFIVAKGIINFQFHNILPFPSENGGAAQSIQFITSDMVIAVNEINVIWGRTDADLFAKTLQTNSSVSATRRDGIAYPFDPDEILPF